MCQKSRYNSIVVEYQGQVDFLIVAEVKKINDMQSQKLKKTIKKIPLHSSNQFLNTTEINSNIIIQIYYLL